MASVVALSIALVFSYISPTPATADKAYPFRREQCPSYDNIKNFPAEIRNQKSQGICWAFSAADLYSEELCLGDRSLCGLPVSVMDLMRCSFVLGGDSAFADTSGNDTRGLQCALNNGGACMENHAPYFEKLKKECFGDENDPSHCVLAYLRHAYDRYQRLTDRSGGPNHCEDSTGSIPERAPEDAVLSRGALRKIDQLVETAGRYLPDQVENGLSIGEALAKAKTKSDFIQSMLIPKQCADNRKLSGGASAAIDSSFFKDDGTVVPLDKRLVALVEGFSFKHSSTVSLCSHLVDFPLGKSRNNPNSPTCANHSVIINAMKWNEKSGRCEVHVRNSWGKNSALSGWMDAAHVLNATFRATYVLSSTPTNY